MRPIDRFRKDFPKGKWKYLGGEVWESSEGFTLTRFVAYASFNGERFVKDGGRFMNSDTNKLITYYDFGKD